MKDPSDSDLEVEFGSHLEMNGEAGEELSRKC